MKFEFRGRSETGFYTVLSVWPTHPRRERLHYDTAKCRLNWAMGYVLRRIQTSTNPTGITYIIRPYDHWKDDLPF